MLSRVQLCNPTDCSTPGFPVLHRLLELAHTHVHQAGDATQPSCPLSSPSPPAFSLSQCQVLSNESALHIRRPEYWSFSFSVSPSNEYLGLISFRINWFDLLALQGTLKSLHLTILKAFLAELRIRGWSSWVGIAPGRRFLAPCWY